MTSRTKGFTLIELLVVISIISLLISILLPALGKARGAARGAQCMSNLKGLGIAFYTYCTDNEGKVPARYFYLASGGVNPSYTWYDNYKAGRGNGLGMYIKSDRQSNNPNSTWFCPSNPYSNAANRQYSPSHSSSVTTYSYYDGLQQHRHAIGSKPLIGYYNEGANYNVVDGWNNLDHIYTPHSKSAAISDNHFWVTGSATVSIQAGHSVSWSKQSGVVRNAFSPSTGVTVSSNTHFGSHHSESTNLVFLDGHARAMTWDAVVNEYPAAAGQVSSKYPYAFNY